MIEILVGLLIVLGLLSGILLGRKSTEPPNDDAFGQELKRWSQEEAELPERARRAGEEAARRVDVRYPGSAKPPRVVP